jgi:leader peptidase (prepilin peptidase)/N-methyltransferase
MADVPIVFWFIFTGFFGAIMGSYVNMAAYRLPRGISTFKRSRSFCPRCDKQLSWLENIPIVSYSIQLGRCRGCKGSIPFRYLWVEVLVAALFLLALYQFTILNPQGQLPAILFAIQLLFIVDMVLLSVCDLEAWIIPIETTLFPLDAQKFQKLGELPAILLEFLFSWPSIGFALALIFPDLHAAATVWVPGSPRINGLIDSFEGMVLGAGILWMVGFLFTVGTFYYYRITGRPDRPKEGMGLGDCHLMAFVGVMLGWKNVLLALAVGLFIGCVTGIGKILWEKFQRARLKENYKPWQPAYPIPEEVPGEQEKPVFWRGLVMGLIVLGFCGVIFAYGSENFSGAITPTLEEMRLRSFGERPTLSDVRMWPVGLMFIIGFLLVISYLFYTHLERIKLLPQGNIVEKGDGQKEEVLEGNYIPFGPSLALGALIVVFYAPMLRNVAWMMTGLVASSPPLPYHLLGEKVLYPALIQCVEWFRIFSAWLAGG